MHPTMPASTSPEAPLEALLFYSPRPKPVPGLSKSLFVTQPTPSPCNCICEHETDFLHLSFPPTGVSRTPLLTVCFLKVATINIATFRFHL